MKNWILLTFFFLSFPLLRAQEIHGIAINAQNKEFVVLLNGEPICEPTSACFIAHLRPNTYNIEVFEAKHRRRHSSFRKRLYQNKVKYSGRGIYQIFIDSNAEDVLPQPPHRKAMDDATFQDFLRSMKKASFTSDKMNMIDLLPEYGVLTSRQCRDIALLFSFENDKVEALKKLYPKVIDKMSFFIAIETLSFSSDKEKVSEFVKKYNRKYINDSYEDQR